MDTAHRYSVLTFNVIGSPLFMALVEAKELGID
jgi:hypothetical protein